MGSLVIGSGGLLFLLLGFLIPRPFFVYAYLDAVPVFLQDFQDTIKRYSLPRFQGVGGGSVLAAVAARAEYLFQCMPDRRVFLLQLVYCHAFCRFTSLYNAWKAPASV